MARELTPADYHDGSLDLFDERPIALAGFELRTRSAVPVGKPNFPQFLGAIQFAHAAHDAAPYWVGDMMRYAETRADWADRMSQALEITGYARQTILNYTSICSRVQEPERRLSPSIAHTDVVAPLSARDQARWLGRARDENLTVRELRVLLRAAERTRILDGQAVLEGMYRVIYADPPWLYEDSGPTDDGSLGKAARHYEGMTVEAICALPVAAHVLDDAVLALWVTAPMLLETPGPREVLAAWGFTYKTNRVWDKVLGMPGHYGTHLVHEHLILATRGHGLPDVPTPQEKSIFVERRGSEHSRKPDEARAWLMKHWTRGPYLELFGREPVAGWSVFGNDARLWGQEAMPV